MRFTVMATVGNAKKNEVLGEVTDCGEDRRTPQEPQKNIVKSGILNFVQEVHMNIIML